MEPCPECGGTDRTEEPGEYALIGLTAGRISLTAGRLRLRTDAPKPKAVVVRVTVCNGCRYVALHESRPEQLAR